MVLYHSNIVISFSIGIAAINSNSTVVSVVFILSIIANCPASVDKSGLLANTLSPVIPSVRNPYTPTFSNSFGDKCDNRSNPPVVEANVSNNINGTKFIDFDDEKTEAAAAAAHTSEVATTATIKVQKQSPAAQALFAAFDNKKNISNKINRTSLIHRRLQTAGWRNWYSQDDYYPYEMDTNNSININKSTKITFAVQQIQCGEINNTHTVQVRLYGQQQYYY